MWNGNYTNATVKRTNQSMLGSNATKGGHAVNLRSTFFHSPVPPFGLFLRARFSKKLQDEGAFTLCIQKLTVGEKKKIGHLQCSGAVVVEFTETDRRWYKSEVLLTTDYRQGGSQSAYQLCDFEGKVNNRSLPDLWKGAKWNPTTSLVVGLHAVDQLNTDTPP